MTVTYHSGRRLQGLSTDFQTSGLKAYWKMNESSGNLLNTASAQNSDSTMSADLVSSGTVNRGQTGHVSGVDSIGFPTHDADGNKVTANNSASDYGFMNKAAAKFTACWWAKNESHNSTVDLWGFGGNGGGTDIQFRNKSSGFTIWFSGTEYTSFTHNVGDNNWHFYMLSWDEDGGSDNAQFQLDGTKQTATVTTSNTSDASNPLIIGDVSGNEPEMDIQEFSLWNRVLTDSEIALIYNSGNGAELQNTTVVGSKPTNVQVGSRLEETDTRKMYYYSDPLTFESDFSSASGWTASDSNDIGVANGKLNWYNNGTNTYENAYYDLGSVSDTKWILRHTLKVSGTPSSDEIPYQFIISNTANANWNTSSSCLGVWVYVDRNNAWRRIYTANKVNSTSGGDNGAQASPRYWSDFAYGTTYYITTTRTSATNMTVEIRTGSHSGSIVSNGTLTLTIPSGITGLRYLTANQGAQGTGLSMEVDDVEFYNDTTSTDIEWKELGT